MNTPVALTQAMAGVPVPMALLAELTHRCPLSCPYCSNPLQLTRRSDELSAAEWADIFGQAARLGVLHVHLSGGEPAARRDLTEITGAAVEAGLYTNLITSGVGLTEAGLRDLAARGLDHVQLSVQGADAHSADRFGGYRGGFEAKMRVASWVVAEGIPLTINAVMHRQNLDRLEEVVALALRLGARRLEVACVQFHGWASRNIAALLPTAAQANFARNLVQAKRRELAGRLVIDFVPPDYHAEFPKACMGGWGRTGLVVAPDGRVLPCHAADTIPGLSFPTVRDSSLADIWAASAAFEAFRGTKWMVEPCRSCERHDRDFGGCRCQALALTGDARSADPVCSKSPHRRAVDVILAEAGREDAPADLVHRENPRSPAQR
jgi:pyrroloquinoline quinone biosynthesis protein E